MSARTHVSLEDGHYITVVGEIDEVASSLNAEPTLIGPFQSGDVQVWINPDHVLHLRPEVEELPARGVHRAA
jgi:hypothetical protein